MAKPLSQQLRLSLMHRSAAAVVRQLNNSLWLAESAPPCFQRTAVSVSRQQGASGYHSASSRRRWFSSSAGNSNEKEAEDHFAVLELEPRYLVSTTELDLALRQQQLRFHPDRLAGKSDVEREAAEAQSAKVNEAVRVLRSPIERAK